MLVVLLVLLVLLALLVLVLPWCCPGAGGAAPVVEVPPPPPSRFRLLFALPPTLPISVCNEPSPCGCPASLHRLLPPLLLPLVAPGCCP